MKDKFGNQIRVGDYVIFSKDDRGRHGKLFRDKVKEIKGKGIIVGDDSFYVCPGCFMRDNSDLIEKYVESFRFLSCLKACGVDNWDGYSLAQEMFDGNN